MARASDARPFKPYVYRGGDAGPPAMAAALKAAGLDAGVPPAAEEVAPDPAPGYEWYRELNEDQEQAELEAERDRYQAAMAAVHEPDPLPAPPEPVAAVPAPAKRCKDCGYLTTAVGHKVACDG